MQFSSNQLADIWPALPQSEWSDTCATLQLWMQVIGKVRLALTPPINHTWNVTLYPTVRGLTTSPMTCGHRTLQIDFDFLAHMLRVETDSGVVGHGELTREAPRRTDPKTVVGHASTAGVATAP